MQRDHRLCASLQDASAVTVHAKSCFALQATLNQQEGDNVEGGK
jgi:hypothetical protein